MHKDGTLKGRGKIALIAPSRFLIKCTFVGSDFQYVVTNGISEQKLNMQLPCSRSQESFVPPSSPFNFEGMIARRLCCGAEAVNCLSLAFSISSAGGLIAQRRHSQRARKNRSDCSESLSDQVYICRVFGDLWFRVSWLPDFRGFWLRGYCDLWQVLVDKLELERQQDLWSPGCTGSLHP